MPSSPATAKKPPPPPRTDPGRRAEERACAHLRRRGWRIVARNWIGGGGELDVVASRWKTLLVVEVRYRADASAIASVDDPKLARTRRAAAALVRQHGLHRYCLRVDLFAYDATWRLTRRRDVFRD